MELSAAIKLIEKGVRQSESPQQWADLGAGSGLFTRALSTLLPPQSSIHAVDQDQKSLSSLRTHNQSQIITHVLNFESADLPFSNLDGLLLANALHFVSDKQSFLLKIKKLLRPDGVFILIEYDLKTANAWVPFPIPHNSVDHLMTTVGFRHVEKIGELPSRYNASMIYSVLIRT